MSSSHSGNDASTEALLAAIVESSDDAIVSKDLNGVVTSWNPGAERIFGYTAAEMVGQSITVLFPPDRLDEEPAILERLRKGERVDHFQTIRRRKDGTLVDVSVTISPVRNALGQIVGASKVARDITFKRQGALREAVLAAIVESSDDAIVSKNLDGIVTSWNRGAERIFGYTAAEMVGQSITVLFPPDRLDEEPAILERLRKGEWVDHFQTIRRRKDGALIDVSVTISPIRDVRGKIVGASKIARDITKQRQLEAAIHRHVEQLNIANEELQVSNEELEAQREELHVSNEELRRQQEDLQLKQQVLTELQEETESIRRISATLAAELDLQALLQSLTDIATELTEAQFGAFFYNVVAPGKESYLLYTLPGVPREAFASFPLPRNTAIFEPTFAGRGVIRRDDITRDPNFGKNPPYHGMPEGHLPVRSYLAVPVKSRSGEVLGGLFFGHAEVGVFTERHERILVAVAAQASVAIDNARLYQRALTAEEQLRLITDAVPALISYVDADGRYRLNNRAYVDWFGLTPEQLYGRHVAEVVGDAAWEAAKPQREAALAGQFAEFELSLRHERLGRRWVHGTLTPHLDSGGEVVGFVSLLVDVTERRRTEDTQRFLAEASRLLAATLDYEVVLANVARLAVPKIADWCAVDLLDEAGALRRVAVQHVEPQKIKLAYDLENRYPSSPDAPHGVRQVLRTGKTEYVAEIPEALLRMAARNVEHLGLIQSLGLCSYIVVPLSAHGRTFGTISFVSAESRRIFTPADVALAEDLAGRAAVAVENGRMYAELQQADRAKNEFLAMLAHELRNPLSPALASLHVLGERTPDDPRFGRAREVAERQIRIMARLVDDLLDVSRITQGRIDLRKRPLDLSRVVPACVEAMHAMVSARQHTLHCTLPGSPLWIDADLTRLEQILSNLLSNAAKYTDPGGTIWIEASREGDAAVVRIRDTGIGIPAALQSRVFDLFMQSDRSLDRSQGGLGIGLTLVRRLTELHGGRVSVSSPGPGKGSEFTVRLPALPAEPAAVDEGPVHSERPASRPTRSALKILVVDDNADAAETLAELLEDWGHRVRVCHDGLSALVRAAEQRPQVVLLDIGLPQLDGYRVAERLRADPALAGTALVAITGYGTEQDRQRSREAGFNHHLVKPVDPVDLARLLDQMMHRPTAEHP